MIDTPENEVTPEADEAKEEAEAERLFAEAAEAREGSQDDGSADAGSDAAAASKTNGADDQGAVTTAGEGTAAAEGQSGGGEGGAAAAATPGEGDIWANVPPEAKAAYDAAIETARQAEHRFKSREGREAALQRQVAELRRNGGQEEPERKPLKDLLKKETVDELGEEYPDLKPVLDALSAAVERIDGVEQQVGEARTVAATAAAAPEARELARLVPDWKTNIQADPDRFTSWVDDQPKRVRDIVSANWDSITNATEAAEVFKRFEQFIAPKPQEDAGGGEPSKRDRQQSGARAARVTAPTSAGGDSDDPEVIFAQAAAKKDRARGIRN